MADTRSEAEGTLEFQLKHATRFRFVREFRFAPPRRWRYDFLISRPFAEGAKPSKMVLVDIDGGGWTGGHRRFEAIEPDMEKQNEAALRGFVVLHVTPNMVKDLRALRLIERALAKDETNG